MYYISSGEKDRVSIEELSNDIANLVKSSILNSCYPIGSIYMSVNSTSPTTLFGGTWEALNEGRVLIGANSTYPVNSKGGEVIHTLAVNEMPSHSHTRGTMNITGSYYSRIVSSSNITTGAFEKGVSGRQPAIFREGYETYDYKFNFDASNSWEGATSEEGGSQPHNNMQPYLAVYMWKRIS